MGPLVDRAVNRVAISGPILAHILQDFGASRGDSDGLLFGHLQKTISPKLEDEDDQSGMQEDLTAIITGFFCSGSSLSFYDARGFTDPCKLSNLVGERDSRGGDPLIGWFSGRRNSPMRPSLREAAVTRYLRLSFNVPSHNMEGSAIPAGGGPVERTAQLGSSMPSSARLLGSPGRATRSSSHAMESSSHMVARPSQMQEDQMPSAPVSGVESSPINVDSPVSDTATPMKEKLIDEQQSNPQVLSSLKLPLDRWKWVGVPPSSPCLFMLLTDCGTGEAVHTHGYMIYQYHSITQTFEPRTTKIVNIGPDFRVHYDSFAPVAPFPPLSSCTEEERDSNSSSLGSRSKRRELSQGSRGTPAAVSKEQMLLDFYSEGYKVERLASLADPDGRRQVSEVEDLYSKMLLKLEILAKQVCESSFALSKQEKANKKLRLIAAGME